MSGPRSRRAVLRMSGTTVASGLIAGCSALGGENDGLVLGDIVVRSAHPDPHTVRVELERSGEPVHEETVVVDESEVERIESTWPSDPAEYVLRYVVFGPDEEPDVRTRTLTAEDDRADGGDCTTVAVSMGFPSGSPPYASTGTPESVGGRCPD